MSVLVRGKGGVGEGGNEGPKLAEHRMKNRLQYCVVECGEVLMESPLCETATIPSVHPSIHPSLFVFLFSLGGTTPPLRTWKIIVN